MAAATGGTVHARVVVPRGKDLAKILGVAEKISGQVNVILRFSADQWAFQLVNAPPSCLVQFVCRAAELPPGGLWCPVPMTAAVLIRALQTAIANAPVGSTLCLEVRDQALCPVLRVSATGGDRASTHDINALDIDDVEFFQTKPAVSPRILTVSSATMFSMCRDAMAGASGKTSLVAYSIGDRFAMQTVSGRSKHVVAIACSRNQAPSAEEIAEDAALAERTAMRPFAGDAITYFLRAHKCATTTRVELDPPENPLRLTLCAPCLGEFSIMLVAQTRSAMLEQHAEQHAVMVREMAARVAQKHALDAAWSPEAFRARIRAATSASALTLAPHC